MTALTQEDRERLERIADELDPPVRPPGPMPFVTEVDAANFLRDLAKPPEPTEQVGDDWIDGAERARVLLEDGKYGQAHAILEALRTSRELAKAEAEDAIDHAKENG